MWRTEAFKKNYHARRIDRWTCSSSPNLEIEALKKQLSYTHKIDVKEEDLEMLQNFINTCVRENTLLFPKTKDQHHFKNGNDHEQEMKNEYNLHYYGYYV